MVVMEVARTAAGRKRRRSSRTSWRRSRTMALAGWTAVVAVALLVVMVRTALASWVLVEEMAPMVMRKLTTALSVAVVEVLWLVLVARA